MNAIGQTEAWAALAEDLKTVAQQEIGSLTSGCIRIATPFRQRVSELIIVIAHARQGLPASVLEVGK